MSDPTPESASSLTISDPHTVSYWDTTADHPDWWPSENYRTKVAAEQVVAERNAEILTARAAKADRGRRARWEDAVHRAEVFNAGNRAAIAAGLTEAHPIPEEPEPAILTERPDRWTEWWKCEPMEWDG